MCDPRQLILNLTHERARQFQDRYVLFKSESLDTLKYKIDVFLGGVMPHRWVREFTMELIEFGGADMKRGRYFSAYVYFEVARWFDLDSHKVIGCCINVLLKMGPFLTNENPDYDNLSKAIMIGHKVAGLVDHSNPAYLPVMNLIESIKKSRYFPLLLEHSNDGHLFSKSRELFIASNPELYHVVPKKFTSKFEENGRIGFRTLSSFRSIESGNIPEDINEGRCTVHFELHGTPVELSSITESFAFCFSKYKKIKDFRPPGGVLYKINMPVFIENLIASIGNRPRHEQISVSKLAYYYDRVAYESKYFSVDVVIGDISYCEQVNSETPSPFIKDTIFVPEREVRLVLSLGSLVKKAPNGLPIGQSLTSLDNNPMAFIEVPNSHDWQRALC